MDPITKIAEIGCYCKTEEQSIEFLQKQNNENSGLLCIRKIFTRCRRWSFRKVSSVKVEIAHYLAFQSLLLHCTPLYDNVTLFDREINWNWWVKTYRVYKISLNIIGDNPDVKFKQKTSSQYHFVTCHTHWIWSIMIIKTAQRKKKNC